MATKKQKLLDAQGRLKMVSRALDAAFPERGSLVRGALTALLAQEHVVVLGPPGTGKSLLARVLSDCVCCDDDDAFFELLLTKFTTVEEVYGPVSFTALKQDQYKRMLDGYAATKKVWFLDEIFKASSAILNTLLTAMNERKFHNGGVAVDIPLQMLIAASNEYPQDESLKALFDRFSFKFWVDYIGDRDAMAGLLKAGGIGEIKAALKKGDLDVLRKAVCSMTFSDKNVETMLNIKAAVENEGFTASDRTWVKAIKIVKARAVLAGRDTVVTPDFMALVDVLWNEHKDRAKLSTVVGNAADPYGARAETLVDAVHTAMRGLPDISLLKTGSKTKVEFMKELAEISGKVTSRRDAALEAQAEAPDNEAIAEAAKIAEEALQQVTNLMSEVTFYRPTTGA
jgi:MoxR-like ATPase